ncbi:hypothetical protein HMPREF9723_00186 [Treponema denticola OTK]|uniref:Uncharacterized protein n=1 Tax=Treponema denticola OTK TaxID=999434 RepID=A0A0F6MSX2_TREDN|nr:hypothetical protein [Treponema denticola]EMB24955.1 hypothetical protein HMPREF9723_00186 [Treponema denticola OTK]
MIFITIFLLLAIYFPFLFSESKKSQVYFNIIIIVSNIALMFLSIFSFYLVRSLSFIGVLIYINLSILIILLNILFTITNIIKTKKIGKLFFLLPILFSTFFSFLIIGNQISEKIALKIEFTKYKKELDRYIANNIKNENIRIFDNYVGIIWNPGFLDNYSVIIYDKNNNLDILYNSSGDTFENKEVYNEFKKAFEYEKIVDIIKIEDNYFRCYIYQ